VNEQQFHPGSFLWAFALTLLVASLGAITVELVPRVKAAREAARRSVCHNTIIQHSGFHGPSCDVCRPTMVEAVRGLGNWADHRDLRKDKIARFAAYDQFDPDVLFALEVAAQDDDQSIREAAAGALDTYRRAHFVTPSADNFDAADDLE
jgi:hypothetical protein